MACFVQDIFMIDFHGHASMYKNPLIYKAVLYLSSGATNQKLNLLNISHSLAAA